MDIANALSGAPPVPIPSSPFSSASSTPHSQPPPHHIPFPLLLFLLADLYLNFAKMLRPGVSFIAAVPCHLWRQD
eukprot:2613570-Rhodomonas_salina.1